MKISSSSNSPTGSGCGRRGAAARSGTVPTCSSSGSATNRGQERSVMAAEQPELRIFYTVEADPLYGGQDHLYVVLPNPAGRLEGETLPAWLDRIAAKVVP